MDDPLYRHIAPDLRRSVYYVLASAAPLALSGFLVSRYVRGEPVASAAGLSVFLLLACMTMIAPLRWAVRIDHQGIARRRCFAWNALWTWDDISSGRIEKQHPYTLSDPGRPWWRRNLHLEYVGAADIARAMSRINEHYRLPSPPQLPEELKIKLGVRRLVRFCANGIEVRDGQEYREYRWSEVRRVHITRMDPVRRDFKAMELVLPDREIELRLLTHEAAPGSWQGATAEVINEYLAWRVPAQRIETDVVGERPARRSDVEKRLAWTRGQRRSFYRYSLILAAILVTVLVYIAGTGNGLQAAVFAVIGFIPLMAVHGFVYRRLGSACLALERQLTSFDGETETARFHRVDGTYET
jgi:hypothetical protein